MQIKIGFVSLGCPKNRIDTEYIIGDIAQDKDFKIVSSADIAEVVVINTCAFIETAKKEAIDTILEFVEKKKNNIKLIVVTGCLAQRYEKEIIENIPEVDIVVNINSENILKDLIKNNIIKRKSYKNVNCASNFKKRVLTTPSHYAYIKIAEGCNNFCSYCAIPYIRGFYKSRTIEDILKEAKWLEEKNVKELILVAQNTTYYGFDIYKKFELKTLLEKLCELNFKWIRFLYAYPENIDKNLVKFIALNKKIIPYFDIPIQHINNTILKNMNRKTTKEEILEKIKIIREYIPNSTIRTSIIAGFPGETNEQFEELLNFIRYIKFDRLGCFSYSKEEGTKAALFTNQIDEKTKKNRTKLIYKESEKIIKTKAKNLINEKVETIIDCFKDGVYIGRTKADAPEVDCIVICSSKRDLKAGDIVEVKVENTKNFNLIGEVL